MIDGIHDDLETALQKVESIDYLRIELPKDLRDIIIELNKEGKNR